MIIVCAGKFFWENPGKIPGKFWAKLFFGIIFKTRKSKKYFLKIIFAEISSGLLLVVNGKIFITPQFGSGAGRYHFFEMVCENGSRMADDRSNRNGEGAATLKTAGVNCSHLRLVTTTTLIRSRTFTQRIDTVNDLLMFGKEGRGIVQSRGKEPLFLGSIIPAWHMR